MIVGGFETNGIRVSIGPIKATSSSVDDLDQHLLGPECRQNLHSNCLLLAAVTELAGDLDMHIGFEQRGADLPHGVTDIRLGNASAPTNAMENTTELFT